MIQKYYTSAPIDCDIHAVQVEATCYSQFGSGNLRGVLIDCVNLEQQRALYGGRIYGVSQFNALRELGHFIAHKIIDPEKVLICQVDGIGWAAMPAHFADYYQQVFQKMKVLTKALKAACYQAPTACVFHESHVFNALNQIGVFSVPSKCILATLNYAELAKSAQRKPNSTDNYVVSLRIDDAGVSLCVDGDRLSSNAMPFEAFD